MRTLAPDTAPVTAAILCCLIAMLSGCSNWPWGGGRSPATFSKNDVVPLEAVVAAAKTAVDDYQANRPAGADPLPPLAQADFHFNTATELTAEGEVVLAVFKLDASGKRHFTKDVTFSYKPPPKTSLLVRKERHDLSSDLAKLIAGAAKSAQSAQKIGNLRFNELRIEVEYGVDRSFSGGPNLTAAALVTVSASGGIGYSDSTVQSVTLTFATAER